MKVIIKVLFVGTFLFLFSSFLMFCNCSSKSEEQEQLNEGMEEMEQKGEETIEGEVQAIDWDEDDNVITISISVEIVPNDTTEDIYFKEYRVAENGKGQELLKLVGQKIKATGRIETDESYKKIIYVRHYEVYAPVTEEMKTQDKY